MKISRSSILLLMFMSTTTTLAQEEYPCFSLKGSKTCSQYSEYYISLVGNVRRYPFLANVSDIASFDTAMTNYVSSPLFYLTPFGCNTNNNNNSIPYARYSLTYLCASIIQDNLYSLPCNYDKGISPPPLCQSTCFDWTSSIKSITNNIDICPNQLEQSNALANLNSSCQIWPGLNGTVSCLLGLQNEPDHCGFDNSDRACTYCKSNSNDPCCQKVTCKHGLSTGAIIGIIIGCLILAGIIGAFIYWYHFKDKKRGKNGISYTTNNGFIMKTKVETQHHHHHHDSTSALGYESLASQGALVPQPPPPPITKNTESLLTIQPPPLSFPSQQQTLEEFYEVRHAYPPQMGDELGLHVGDIVCVAMNFDDGWALGFNVTTGLKGVFPIVCVTPAPEELLEQLLYNDQPTNKTLVEDGSLEHLNMQQICENLRRSMSASSRRTTTTTTYINTLPTSDMTQHNNIPRRTASMMKHNNNNNNNNYDYRESDSPTSPTLHTPFFNDPSSMLHHQHHTSSSTTTLSQPEPALFQPIETFEMHRKNNNRVSKLEEE